MIIGRPANEASETGEDPSQPPKATTAERRATRASDMRAEYPTVPSAPRDQPHPGTTPPWLVALDTGGTFTDIVARSPGGTLLRAKVPSDGSILATVVQIAAGGDDDGELLVYLDS